MPVPPHGGQPALRFASPVSLLWRTAGVLQVGLDAGSTLLLPDAPAAARAALAAFRAWRTPAEVLRRHPDLDRRWFATAVATLRVRGVLVAASQRDRRTVGVVGGGPLAREVAAQLLRIGHAVWAADPSQPERDAHQRAAHRGRWRQVDQPGNPGTFRLLDHWQSAFGHPAELVLTCPTTATVDRALTDQLVREGQPHLVVGLEAERAIVGPLVVPGVTACLLCEDLARRDADADWPRVVEQLIFAPAEAPTVIRRWAVSMVVAQALAYLRGGRPETLGATIELASATWTLGTRRLRRHPACACARRLAEAA